MKFSIQAWTRWFHRRGGEQESGVDHVRAGQVLSHEEDPSLLLKGRCEILRHDAVLQPGDAISPAGTNGGTIRALVDSTVLRLSRETLHRLAQRWPVNVLWPDHQPAPGVVRRMDGPGPGGRVVCLLPLSDGIPCADLAMSLAETLSTETSGPVLRLRVGESDAVEDRSPTGVPGHSSIFLQRLGNIREAKALDVLARSLERGREQFPHVIVEMARDASVEIFREVLGWSRAIYPILRQDGESLFELNLLVREARSQALETIPIKPLVYLAPGENAHGLGRYIEATVKRPVHQYLREGDESRLKANLRRLGREMCGRQVGLALSAGGAFGLSHIGVIQVLEENGIEVDVVAGSSMGAYIAAVWGAGHAGRDMEKFARELEGYRGAWRLVDLAVFPRRGFLHTKRVRERLERTIGNAHFSDMARPVRVVATRLDTLEQVVFSDGSMVDAVLASIAIPGVCVPVTLDGISFIDGGICDPLPVDVLAGMGIGKIIAVNTIATPQTLRAFKHELAEVEQRRKGKFGGWLNLFASGNAFDTLMRSLHAAQTRLAEASCLRAGVVLRPYTCEGRWHDFGTPLRYISLGREETLAKLPAIRALIESPVHENDTSQHIVAQAA